MSNISSSLLSRTQNLTQSTATQITNFYDIAGTGAFFATPSDAKHTILRLKDGMDTSDPSTNGTSASNLFRLSSLLHDEDYGEKAKETVQAFESEILQYPWLFGSFMPGVVAGRLGVRGVVVVAADGDGDERMEKVEEFEKAPRGGLGTFAKIGKDASWLRERNTLLKDVGKDGKTRVLVCEGGRCVEEGESEGAKLESTPVSQDTTTVPSSQPPTSINQGSESSTEKGKAENIPVLAKQDSAIAAMVQEDQKAIAQLAAPVELTGSASQNGTDTDEIMKGGVEDEIAFERLLLAGMGEAGRKGWAGS